MKRSLLILDDDPVVATIIRMMAERLAFEVAIADSAASFFEALESRAPSHVAVDLMMPVVDGVEILLELARRECKAHIIITSGAGSRVLDAARRASSENGLNVLGTLPKPFSFSNFRALVSQEGARREPEFASEPKAVSGPVGEVSEAELREAIEQRQIGVAYQPKIRCADYELFGFEALARWRHPLKGNIAPATFIALAEACDLIDGLSELVVEQALDWLGARFPGSDLHLAINLSPKSLGDLRLADRLAAAASARSIDARRIVLEVTETSAMADPSTTLSLSTRLRLKGFELSIDDFGIGYSSLVQLARLPFSELKIDTSFVRPLATSQECQKIVGAIIGLGHSLGLRVTAEGVEDAQSLALLRDMACDLAQGYHIGRPMAAEAVSAWMTDSANRTEDDATAAS